MNTPEQGGEVRNEATPPQPNYLPTQQFVAGGPPPYSQSSSQAQPPQQRKSRGLALAAFITGIAAFLLAWIPIVGLLIALAAVTLGIIALVKKQQRWMAITGTILGGLGLLTAIIVAIAFASVVSSDSPSDSASTPESTAAPAESPAAPSTTEPEPEPEPAPVAVAPDLSTFAPTDDRTFALIAKDPDSSVGTNLIIFGTITQLDSATGNCNMLVSAGAAQTEFSYDYAQNSLATSGDGDTSCPVLAPLVEGDHVKLWVTVLGSYSYDTQIGGNTTVPSFEVWQAELLPVQEY